MIEGIKHILLVSLIISVSLSIFSLSIFSAASAPVPPPTFSDDFNSDSGLWKYWGTAHRQEVTVIDETTGGYLVLTDAQNQTGAVWFKYMFKGDFTANFKYQITGGPSTSNTDSFGMVMMFLKERNYAKWGSPGGGYMGFSNPNEPCYGYGIEFDGSQDGWDPTPYSHIALIKDSTDSIKNHLCYKNNTTIGDGNWHDAKIDVIGASVKVYIDEGTVPVLNWSGTINNTYGCFGFSAGDNTYPRNILIDNFSITIPEGSYEEYVPSILETYIDPRQQTDVQFGYYSFWHQPWRAYMDTWPVSWLLNSAGINFFSATSDNTLAEEEAVAEHLAKNGFKYARVEVGWGLFDYDHPDQMITRYKEDLSNVLKALQKENIRPLILLNANDRYPCPIKSIQVQLVQDANQDTQQVQLQTPDGSHDIQGIVEDRTGFENFIENTLITKYDSSTGWATLSRPLPKELKKNDANGAINYWLYVLKYRPFGPIFRADGTFDPETNETFNGWIDYVNSVATYAKEMLGTEGKPDAGFDFEVWNELSFGSNFLDLRKYYDNPKLPGWDDSRRGWFPIDLILEQTVRVAKKSGNQNPGVRVGDGFSSQTPFAAVGDTPIGLDALDKHPYPSRKTYSPYFPLPDVLSNQTSLDAYGEPDGTPGHPNWVPAPYLTVLFPEYCLTALQTEYLCRDISPITTDIYDTEHGRYTYPQGGTSLNTENMWVTEVNINPVGDNPSIAPDEAMHIKAKTTLRYLVSFNNKGIERIYFFQGFEGEDTGLGMVSEAFFNYVHEHQSYPPDTDYTSPVMLAVRNLMAYMGKTNVSVTQTRQLELLQVEEPDGRIAVFNGDGTWAHPTVNNRDVFAFFPYQADEQTFVIPYYVMTRDVMHIYQSNLPGGDPKRFDMEPENFVLTIGNVKGCMYVGHVKVDVATVEAYDPLLDKNVPVTVVSRGTNSITLSVEATDYPRILRLSEIYAVTAPAPVGGIAFPANKLALLAPYIILAALIAIGTVSVAVYWRKRQQVPHERPRRGAMIEIPKLKEEK